MGKRVRFRIPLKDGMGTENPPIFMNPIAANFPSMNVRVNSNRIEKRPGYSTDRTISPTPQIVSRFNNNDGTENTVFVNEYDLMTRETASGGTYSYKTETGDYNSGVASISGDTVTFKAGTTLQTDGVAANDYFILDADHDSDSEPDTNWAKIDSVDSELQLTLTANYTGTTGSWPGSEKNSLIRKVYSLPTDERWDFAIVDDKFCFTNGNVDVQYWDGSGYASALDSTNAKKARYCIEYANRLLLADVEISSSREPWTLQWSKEGDPTNLTDSTAGSVDFLDTMGKIVGLGKVGKNIIVYKEDSIIVGDRTGNATSPLVFPHTVPGVRINAPYSIVAYDRYNAFLGEDDFYIFDGNTPMPIGDKIRYTFFDITEPDARKNVFALNFPKDGNLIWFADTKWGQIGFVFDYKNKCFYTYEFADTITGGGDGNG